MIFWFIMAVTAVATGLLARWLAPQFAEYDEVSWVEFGIGLVIILAVLVPIAGKINDSLSVSNQINGFHEYLNGSIIKADVTHETCTEDGGCDNTYQCDPYEVTHYTYDSKGNINGSYTTTEYHDCPYVTEELTYSLVSDLPSSLANPVTVTSASVFAPDPQPWRASDGEGIPSIQRGPDALWAKDAALLKQGTAPSMTTTHDYANFILASESTNLKQYSPDIKQYRKEKLLPWHTNGLPDHPLKDQLLADKFQFVGMSGDTTAWNDALAGFNAQLGTQLQGDMHVVVVPAAKISDPEAYINALSAYWQSPTLGKWGLSKNGIALVLGVKGNKIEWAKAKTGMPIGNGSMLDALQDRLTSTPFTVDSVFGTPAGRLHGSKVIYAKATGLVPQIVFHDFPFLRGCMQCVKPADKGHGTSYVYLTDQIKPAVSGLARTVEWFLLTLISIGIWALLALGLHIKEKTT